jgi:myo-inositol catabolism protein IolC
MVSDTVQDKQIRRSIIQQVENMDARLLHRIVYEIRCEEMGLYPDGWKLYPEEE